MRTGNKTEDVLCSTSAVVVVACTFKHVAGVRDGLLLGLPQLEQVQIRGHVELVQHPHHLLPPVTLPERDHRRSRGVVVVVSSLAPHLPLASLPLLKASWHLL